jgi:3-hydroxy acid dehydrogenase/malonic semialdehyde reductase
MLIFFIFIKQRRGRKIMQENLKGKIAFITGASSGIGEALAKKLASNGVHLILASRKKEKLETLAANLSHEYGVKVKVLVMDVSIKDQVLSQIKSLEPEWHNISILINNAGLVLGLNKFQDSALTDQEIVMNTNMQGLVYVTYAILPYLLKRSEMSDIINIGSIAGDSAYPGGSIYCATKAMVKTFSDGLRIDLVDTPIRVTNVKPGMVETNFSNIRFKGDEKKAKSVYQGLDPLNAENVAQVIESILKFPYPIQIAEITVFPLQQASGTVVSRKN